MKMNQIRQQSTIITRKGIEVNLSMHALHEAKYNTKSSRPVEVTVGETVSINWTELFRQCSF